MSFKDIQIDYSYESVEDDLLNEFYIPLLSKSTSYDRIAGFFTSSSLTIAAKGIAGLIKNNGTMRLIASPHLDRNDIEIMEQVIDDPEAYISNCLLRDISNIENDFQMDHLRALGWMLANGFLEIKIALIKNSKTNSIDYSSLFHQKIGLMTDEFGSTISFSGSINETASGWLSNIEEFKVFKSWEKGQVKYLNADKDRFNDLWNGLRDNIIVKPLPYAVKEKLVILSDNYTKESLLSIKYLQTQHVNSVEDKLELFFYQREAFDKWIENDYRLLFEMATGTGKTRTAIACINHFIKRENKGLIIIGCPQSTLSMQWKTEIDELNLPIDKEIIADSSNNWRNDLKNILNQIKLGYFNHVIIYSTHATTSNKYFTDLIKKYAKGIPICFVGDEVHGLGAYKTKNALLDIYDYRIGLSATPNRWFDDYGTKILEDYFGQDSYHFTINQALNTINPLTNKPFLVDFEYYPIFVELNDEELEEYKKLTNRIRKLSSFNTNSDEYQENLKILLNIRANIGKNAESKIYYLEKIIKNITIKDTIIFTSPAQIDDVLKLLHKYDITSHRFTEKQGTSPEKKYGNISEREYLISKFKNGLYKSLVAIKCLDEGIDIPSAQTAILMSSSTNPREYIQRVGRVIRQSHEKNRAYIYDFVIAPNLDKIFDSQVVEFEKKIFNKEITRVKDMSMNAINNASVLEEINNVLRRINYGS